MQHFTPGSCSWILLVRSTAAWGLVRYQKMLRPCATLLQQTTSCSVDSLVLSNHGSKPGDLLSFIFTKMGVTASASVILMVRATSGLMVSFTGWTLISSLLRRV